MKRRVRIPIIVILLLLRTCVTALIPNCPASSCGNIPNITYPFRLTTDPSHCGDIRYQLHCQNNATLLTLFSGTYKVQQIDYKRYKIRVSDAEDGTCSCSDPITDDPRYVAVEGRGCEHRGHVYAVVRDWPNGFGVQDIKVGCQLKVATLATARDYKMLSQGFELSWLYVICEDRCGKGIECSVVDESTDEVRCDPQNCRYIYEQPNTVTYDCSSGSTAADIIFGIGLFCIGLYRGFMQNFGLNKATGYDGDSMAEIGKSVGRLYPLDKSIITLTDAKGTLGYMAPELFYHNMGRVSHKSDVYSFGMLLMEMANKKRNFNPHADDSGELFFPFWIYNELSGENEIKGKSVSKQEYNNEVKKMFLVALWCIQLKPSDRPPMNKVVEMLEGELENIEMPPKPFLYQVNDHNIKSYQTLSNDSSGSTSYTEDTVLISSEHST
ncbi:hypothetical protein VNO80_02911 [Phaseolus coccineus]|uniref:SWIM-type domain-containing protein n=1 Tax=Phaseolus coccineus TaxID=3886 RepID=A0AAN9NR29_PHACN